MEILDSYLPIDRRFALSGVLSIPEYNLGATLFADISGFTMLAEALSAALGPRRGAEEITNSLNLVYNALVDTLHHYGGTVISFSGDAMTCWFPEAVHGGDATGEQPVSFRIATLRAVGCAMAMQKVMTRFAALPTPDGTTIALAIKIGIAAGLVRRIVVGDPAIQLIDTLAGRTMDRLAAAEHQAERGEIVLDAVAAAQIGADLAVHTWRSAEGDPEPFAVVAGLHVAVPAAPWPPLPANGLQPEQLRPWLLPAVYQRVLAGGGEFLAELRPAVALFLRFGGVDFDRDPAGTAHLDTYIRAVQAIVTRYGGAVLQLAIGDKGCYLYGAFGALHTYEDDAARAATAALEIQAIVHPVVHAVQIGVSAGQMRVGAYGGMHRRTYGALGDEVNIAARLMSAAAPGQILFTPTACTMAGDRFRWLKLPLMHLKGKRTAMHPFALEGVVTRSGPRIPSARALVGRDAELAQLQAVMDAAADAPQLVLLEGDIGSGKSRLLAAIAAYAEQRGMSLLHGEAHAIEQTTPYYFWRAVLGAALGLNDTAALLEWRRRIEDWVAAHAPDLSALLPLLNAIIPLDLPETAVTEPLGPAERATLLTTLVIALIHRQVTGVPVLLIDDAHWSDSRSWALAAALARSALAEHRPLLLVLAMRPLDHEAPAEMRELLSLPGLIRLQLGPLSSEAIRELVATRLEVTSGELPAELIDLLHDRAEGSPFLAEELTLALREQGLIHVTTLDRGRRHVALAATERLHDALPRSVQGVVLARLDTLSLEEQLTLKVGAVIGRYFSYRLLRTVMETNFAQQSATLGGWLLALTRRDLLRAEDERTGRYVFRQSITRDIVYSTLLYAQRRSVHRLVAEWYERTYPGPERAAYYALLAAHWDAAEVPANAAHYLELAGEQALAAGAPREARELFERVRLHLDQLPANPERAAVLHLRLGTARWYSGDLQAAQADLRWAADTARSNGAQRVSAEALSLLGRVRTDAGEYQAARAALNEALALADQLDDEAARLRCTRYLGVVDLLEGDLDTAKQRLEYALAQARRVGDRFALLSTLISLGNQAMQANDLVGCTRYYHEALEIAHALGHRWSEAIVLANLGELAARAENLAEARELARRSMAIDRTIGNWAGVALTMVNLADMACTAGDYADAVATLREALPLSVASSNLFALCALYVVARTQILSGEPDQAAALLYLTINHQAGNEELRAQARSLADEHSFDLAEAPEWYLETAVAVAEDWLEAQSQQL